MKIGIITFFNYCNFGAALQSYGLSETLKALGHEPEYIDYTCPFISRVLGLNSLKKRGAVGYVYTAAGRVFYLPRNGLFRAFRELIPHTAPVTRANLHEYADCYDRYITGSDQVWSAKLTDFDTAYFLDFVTDGAKKLSYAASFGESGVDESRREDYVRLLSDIPSISVREDYGAELVKSFTGREAEVLPDPTLLLRREDWAAIAAPSRKKRPTLLVYQLGFSSSLTKAARQLAREKRVHVDYIPFPMGSFVPGRFQLHLGPREWLAQFRDADYILTDSFHGIVFAILFQKKFLVRAEGQHKNLRVISLLNHLGLSDRIIGDTVPDIERKIDYDRVNAVLEQDRQHAIDWLREHLEE